MTILARTYTCYLLISQERDVHLWSKKIWLENFELLDEAIQLTRGPHAKIEHDGLRKLGQLRWSQENISKWFVDDSTENRGEFSHGAIWCPSPSTVDKEQNGPDAYIDVHKMYNEFYKEAILACIAEDFEHHDKFSELLEVFLQKMTIGTIDYKILKSERPWGKRPKENIRNEIPFYLGDIDFSFQQASEFNINTLPGSWHIFPEEELTSQ